MDNAYAVELADVADRMAQDLREYADAAKESGSSAESTELLLAEWDEVNRRIFKTGEYADE